LETFDENGDGKLIEPEEIGWPEAYARTQELLKSSETPIFEATIRDQMQESLARLWLGPVDAPPETLSHSVCHHHSYPPLGVA
jgi:hypothetical protein